jgi:integrase
VADEVREALSAGFRMQNIRRMDKKIWAVPANRMKAGRGHRVPLSGRAVSILKQLAKPKTGDFVFPGQARGKPLSNMAMEMMLRRMKIGRDCPRLPFKLPRLGGERVQLPARSDRDGAGSRHRGQSGAGLSA